MTHAPDYYEGILSGFPALQRLTRTVDQFLESDHPSFFGAGATHPVMALKRQKVVHDNVWGTNLFSWQELALIDSPVLQRLRRIHQVGLAYQVYPSARHTRFEHCLGVATVASKIFDALAEHRRGPVNTVLKSAFPSEDISGLLARVRLELRLAALLHDTGHSICSHTSELVFQHLGIVKAASAEISAVVGKEKGAGEALSFAFAMSKSVAELLERAKSRIENPHDNDVVSFDLRNVAFLIVGRATHPFLQFLADIVSSAFDADKLDYLMRDAKAAGLPLSYDLDRYLYSVDLYCEPTADGEGVLKRFYEAPPRDTPIQKQPDSRCRFPHYDSYRLRLPPKAMSSIEQIVICKLMLFGYIYHHPKVRAAEGLLRRILEAAVEKWRREGKDDEYVLTWFLKLTDDRLELLVDLVQESAPDYIYRVKERLLPREVCRLNGQMGHGAPLVLLQDYLTKLQDPDQRAQMVENMEVSLGAALCRSHPELFQDPQEALAKAGAWLDVPKSPYFKELAETRVESTEQGAVNLNRVFPIDQWTQAYQAYRYYVRIFCFSEYSEHCKAAALAAISEVTSIEDEAFLRTTLRDRP